VTDERITINRLTWARCGRAVVSFLRSEVGLTASAWLAFLIGLLFAINGLNVLNSYVGRDFMTAIEQQSMPRFWRYAGFYVGVFALLTLAAVLYRFAEEKLALLWREWLTRRLTGFYLEGLNYYHLKDRKIIDNPDQRIADDVRAFTTTTLSFLLLFLNGTFTIVAFSGVLWSISPTLFGVAVTYAAVGSALTVLLGRRLVWLSYRQADREAAFRAELVHVRENAETIALSRREERLAQRVSLRVKELTENARSMIHVNRNLGFFTTGYNYLIQVIPAFIVAPLFIRGEAEFGVIPQSAMAFTHLLGAFSLIITQFQSITSYGATVARLSGLAEAMEGMSAARAAGVDVVERVAASSSSATAATDPAMSYEHVTLRSPRRSRVLVDDLNTVIAARARVFVTAADELALVALFRASAGVWDFGTGRIVRPAPDDILFVPERPYLPPGTLREVLVRAERESEVTNATIEGTLHSLGIESLAARSGGCETEQDWDNILSLREQQLLAIARVIVSRPRCVFLDRIMTTLTPEDGERALTVLQANAMGYVAFGATNGAAAHFDATLIIGANGKWSWSAEKEAGARG
jgi:putative ATP-binding cassette transporter